MAEIEKDRRIEGPAEALASLTTCVRSILIVQLCSSEFGVQRMLRMMELFSMRDAVKLAYSRKQ